jgi:hypothetical protein
LQPGGQIRPDDLDDEGDGQPENYHLGQETERLGDMHDATGSDQGIRIWGDRKFYTVPWSGIRFRLPQAQIDPLFS